MKTKQNKKVEVAIPISDKIDFKTEGNSSNSNKTKKDII